MNPATSPVKSRRRTLQGALMVKAAPAVLVDRLLTLAEAADRLQVSVRTLGREAAAGRLAIVQVRSQRRIRPSELERYIAASEATTCQSERREIAGKSESASAMAAALNAVFPLARPASTPSPSKRKSVATWLRQASDDSTTR